MLIERSGKVKCARIISVGSSIGLTAPPPGLYDSIRNHLLRWRFDPPMLHGKLIDVRWGMQINPIMTRDTNISGPAIYPICLEGK